MPSQYQSLYNTMQSNINGYNSLLSGSGNGSTVDYSWAVYRANANVGLGLLSEMSTNPPLEQVDQELDMDKAMGLKMVSLSIDFPLFDSNFYAFNKTTDDSQQLINYFVQVAQAVHSRGMKVLVESNTLLTVDAIGGKTSLNATSYYKSLSLAQYEAGRSATDLIIAQQIKPDYLLLQTEPDTDAYNAYRPELNNPTTDVQMVSQIATNLTNANIPGLHTSIKVGSGAGTWLTNWNGYISGEIALTGAASLDFLDTHIYSVTGTGIQGQEVNTALQMINMAHAAGKGFGISEFWPQKTLHGSDPESDLRARDMFSFWEPIDAQFLSFMAKLASDEHLDYLSVGQNYFYANYVNYASSPCDPTYPAPSQSANVSCDGQITSAETQLASQAITAGQLSSSGLEYKNTISTYSGQ